MLNQDLEQIHVWANKCIVNFNPNKTESILVSRKVKKPHHHPLIMNNVHVAEVDQHKHLGVTFSNTGTWQ